MADMGERFKVKGKKAGSKACSHTAALQITINPIGFYLNHYNKHIRLYQERHDGRVMLWS